jgi:hypothetical protein
MLYWLVSKDIVAKKVLCMTMTTSAQIASALGLNESTLFQTALISLLQEKKRQILQLRLETLARYNTSTLEELEVKIAQGSVAEHPAWEDLITVENLTARLEELDVYLSDLRSSADPGIN